MLTINDFKLALEEEIHLLPDQSPLEHFVHHNNLHHFEDQNFEETIEKMYKEYGKSPYMPLAYYREKLRKKEISKKIINEKLEKTLKIKLDETILNYIINHLFKLKDERQIQFNLNEELILDENFRKLIPIKGEKLPTWNYIQNLENKFNDIEISDFHVNNTLERADKLLIPFYATLIDQGQANLSITSEDKKNPWQLYVKYLKTILTYAQLKKLEQFTIKEENILEFVFERYFKKLNSIKEMRIHLRDNLNATPGWAGIFHKTSTNKEVTPRRESQIKIEHFLLFRLVLNEIFGVEIKNKATTIYSNYLIKAHVFHYYHCHHIKIEDLKNIYNVFSSITPTDLQKIFHQSYEETYGNYVLSGIQKNNINQPSSPKYQIYFCIDDREESIRRYLEEESHEIATYGVAGFFGLDMKFQGSSEIFPRRMCPPAANPQFLIKEKEINSENDASKRFVKNLFYDGNTSFFSTVAKNFILTFARAITFKIQLYFPKLMGEFIKNLNSSRGEFKIDHLKNNSQENNLIYSTQDAAARVAAILKGAGTVKDFGRYLIFIGHGHDSFNNPHVAAYRCGACSGANGSPNAKIFADMGNNVEVRRELAKEHQIIIPEDTYFISGYHDTCNDKIEFYNLDIIKMNKIDQEDLLQYINKARCYNSKERILKFYQSPKNNSFKKALNFVENRAWNIAEPRPELNHASNALCIVAKRSLTKDIYLDRKAFLVSYDQEIDEKGKILEGLLRAVMPVCSGINLEYYFSKVDTENYGSGSKTSHNVTGLTGVMNGIRGDLRTGLVWQMVEYHDPLRILFIVETSEEIIQTILTENKNLNDLVKNKWILLSIVDPRNNKLIKKYSNGHFIEFIREDHNFSTFSHSSEVHSTQEKPCHLAYIGN